MKVSSASSCDLLGYVLLSIERFHLDFREFQADYRASFDLYIQNLNQEHHLCTASEFSISVQRFQTIASILQRASVENRYLFPEGPLDKLASTSL
jgi:hypothetical protein